MKRFSVFPLCVAMLLPATSSGHADTNFATFTGTWTGSGQVRLDSGATERIKCNAYYTPKDEGNSLGIVLRCASTSYKIELRSQLRNQAGRVSGTWEERNFNASGNVSGQASSGRLNLSVIGGGMTGTMVVNSSGGSHTVVITTQGTGLRSVNISLSRG